MAASYVLKANAPVTQVLSPTVTQDAQLATIQTLPSNVIASIVVSQVSFDANQAAETLTALANNIETIIGQGKAVGGTGTSDLDASGLTAYYVTFEVAYNPPGSITNAINTDVDVPVNLLSISDPEINSTLLAEAEAMVNKAYQSLVSLAGG